MDPLSIAASVAGLYATALQISSILKILVESTLNAPQSARNVLQEISAISTSLVQLQRYTNGVQALPRSRASLVMVEQVVVVLTDCTVIFAELEELVDGFRGEGSGPMRVVERVKWMTREGAVVRLLERLRGARGGLGFMLTALNCVSLDEANASIRHLTDLVEQVLESNQDMARRIRELDSLPIAFTSVLAPSWGGIEIAETIQVHVTSEDVNSTLTPCPIGFTFEEDLQTSRVYGRAALQPSRKSMASSNVSVGWSCLSGLSLSDISHISVITLPISIRELWNHQRYSQVSDTAGDSLLKEWYNSPAHTRSFIRSSPKDTKGEILNQYGSLSPTDQLIYTRFSSGKFAMMPMVAEGAQSAYWTDCKSHIEPKENRIGGQLQGGLVRI